MSFLDFFFSIASRLALSTPIVATMAAGAVTATPKCGHTKFDHSDLTWRPRASLRPYRWLDYPWSWPSLARAIVSEISTSAHGWLLQPAFVGMAAIRSTLDASTVWRWVSMVLTMITLAGMGPVLHRKKTSQKMGPLLAPGPNIRNLVLAQRRSLFDAEHHCRCWAGDS